MDKLDQEVDTEEIENDFGLEDIFGDGEKGDELAETPSEELVKEDELSKEPEKEPEPEIKKPEPEPPKENEELAGLRAAIAAERRKRQAAEEALRAIQEKEKPVDLFEDPEKRLWQLEKAIDEKVERKFIDLSEAHCASKHDDYHAMKNVFVEMASNDPSLIDKMRNQPDPAEWAYKQAKNKQALSEIGDDPAAYRAKLEAEITARVLEKMKSKPIEDKINTLTKTPIPAADIRGKTTRTLPVISDDPLGEVFGER